MEVTVIRHCVGSDPESGLSPLQNDLLTRPEKVRIAEAPTGAGKSYAFERAVQNNERVLFIVPTRRLAQNLLAGLISSLKKEGWSDRAMGEKLVLWNSDETKRQKEAGETNIGARRVREVYSLNDALEGGEMIIAVPEVVSAVLLRYRPQSGQADTGVFEILNNFEHIVFDEFHTISPRGFGLAALFAKLAAEYSSSRAKVTFLSATPLDIAPVLRRLDVPEKETVQLHEELVSEGRAVHGDVRLTLENCDHLPNLVRERIAGIQNEIEKGRQVVIIYNALADLQRHLGELEQIFREAGIGKGHVLVIDSIDDSRTHTETAGFFAAGRRQNPEQFDLLIATASVEMGVTFKADLLIMEPGFEPMNFLQRYGRAARGDHAGHVIVRYDGGIERRQPWFRNLRKWVEKNDGNRVEISELTKVLTRQYQKRFADCPEEETKYFGRLPNRAAYSAGLYWNVLMDHFSNRGHRWKHLQTHQPRPAKTVYFLLKKVRAMESGGVFSKSAKDWCNRFAQEARTLRDIGKGIRIVEGNGGTLYATELWLRRNVDILDRYPIVMAEDGEEEVRISGTLQSHLLEEKQFVPAVRNARFPHTEYIALIKDDAFLVENWSREFTMKTGTEAMAWEFHPEAMAAAEKLVRLTGLVVSDDTELDANSGVL